jgi:hypothetical protein
MLCISDGLDLHLVSLGATHTHPFYSIALVVTHASSSRTPNPRAVVEVKLSHSWVKTGKENTSMFQQYQQRPSLLKKSDRSQR